MGSLTCLTDPAALVVIDTSAAINLIATGCAADILRALPIRLLAVDAVPAELEEGRRRGRPDADLMSHLVAARLIEIVTLGDMAAPRFEELVIGPAAATLDDGEAATIACAAEHGGIALIDERKANRICGERFPKLRVGCTVDLFAHPDVLPALGHEKLAEAVLNALQQARMRVLPHHVDWVVGLIGIERASLCPSLPRQARSFGPMLISPKT
jgi:predicted nucleic acid-binding protein